MAGQAGRLASVAKVENSFCFNSNRYETQRVLWHSSGSGRTVAIRLRLERREQNSPLWAGVTLSRRSTPANLPPPGGRTAGKLAATTLERSAAASAPVIAAEPVR